MNTPKEYLENRRGELESQIASEQLGGNDFKLSCLRNAPAEITAVDCWISNMPQSQTNKDLDKRIEKSAEFITTQMLSMRVQSYSGGCNLVKKEMRSIADALTSENAQLKAEMERLRDDVERLKNLISLPMEHHILVSKERDELRQALNAANALIGNQAEENDKINGELRQKIEALEVELNSFATMDKRDHQPENPYIVRGIIYNSALTALRVTPKQG